MIEWRARMYRPWWRGVQAKRASGVVFFVQAQQYAALSFVWSNVFMEQEQTNPRAVLGAIVAGSATAISFLLWLLYVHQASAQFAGQWNFLLMLNAYVNGLSAIELCVGF